MWPSKKPQYSEKVILKLGNPYNGIARWIEGEVFPVVSNPSCITTSYIRD